MNLDTESIPTEQQGDGNISSNAETASLGEALRNAQPFDFNLTSTDTAVEESAKAVYVSVIQTKSAPNFHRIKAVVVAVLLNLLSAYWHDPERYVRYSRDPKRYNRSRYNTVPVAWRQLRRVVAGLQAAALIEHHDGVHAFTQYSDGRQSRMRATPALIRLMAEHGVAFEMIQRAPDEVIILKDCKDDSGESGQVEYRDDSQTDAMRRDLTEINALLSATKITLAYSPKQMRELNKHLARTEDRFPVNFLNKRLRRVFNNRSWYLGGRFYHSWWQQIPEKDRAYITINGNSTVELDFSAMHFCIFYSEAKLTMPDDPYTLPGASSFDRDVIKLAAQCMINASDLTEATRALRRESRDSRLSMPQAYPDPKILIRALAKKHSPIRHLFCSGAGIKAQNIDSQVAARVLLTLTAKGIPTLPVHDSFIVEKRHEELLRTTMVESFAAVTDGSCAIKPSKALIGRREGWTIEDLRSDY